MPLSALRRTPCIPRRWGFAASRRREAERCPVAFGRIQTPRKDRRGKRQVDISCDRSEPRWPPPLEKRNRFAISPPDMIMRLRRRSRKRTIGEAIASWPDSKAIPPTKPKYSSRFSLCLPSPNGPSSSTQADWANRADLESTSRADFSELLAAQRFRCCVFEKLKSRDARKIGQK
jgi:hypothetical protein